MEKSAVISSLFWKFLERIGAQGVQFIITIILARLLSPNDFGLIALLTILRYNPSLKSIDISRPIPHYQYSNWMDDVAIHIAHMLEVIIYLKKN